MELVQIEDGSLASSAWWLTLEHPVTKERITKIFKFRAEMPLADEMKHAEEISGGYIVRMKLAYLVWHNADTNKKD